MKMNLLKKLSLFAVLLNSQALFAGVTACITVDGNPNPGNPTPYRVCWNVNFNLSATNCDASPDAGPHTYDWKKLPSVTWQYTGQTWAKTTTEIGTYVVRVTNNGTSAVDYDTVVVAHHTNSLTAILLRGASQQTKCQFNLDFTTNYDTINTSYSGSGSPTNFTWYTLDGSNVLTQISGQTSNSLNYVDANYYYVVYAQDPNGCTIGDTTGYISGLQTIGLELGSDPSPICQGTSTNIVSSAPSGIIPLYNYEYFLDGVSVQTGTTSGSGNPPPAYSYTVLAGAHKIRLRVNLFPYCPNLDSVTVTGIALPDVSGPATGIQCDGGSYTTQAVLNAGTGVSYSWSPTTDFTGATSLNGTVNLTAPSRAYTLTATNSCGNDTYNVTVSLNPAINAGVGFTDTTICFNPAGSVVLLGSGSGGTGSLSYAWTPTTALTPANGLAQNPTAAPTASTSYTLTVTDANNCTKTAGPVDVNVLNPYIPVFPVNDIVSVVEGTPVNLEAYDASNAGFTFLWTDMSTVTTVSNTSLYTATFAAEDTIIYRIRVTDPVRSCVNEKLVEVRYISNNMVAYLPNVFSPSATDPLNQKLFLFGEKIVPEEFNFQVYDRWGNVMYKSDTLGELKMGWDGKDLQEGVYTWVLKCKFQNGESTKRAGTFTYMK